MFGLRLSLYVKKNSSFDLFYNMICISEHEAWLMIEIPKRNILLLLKMFYAFISIKICSFFVQIETGAYFWCYICIEYHRLIQLLLMQMRLIDGYFIGRIVFQSNHMIPENYRNFCW